MSQPVPRPLARLLTAVHRRAVLARAADRAAAGLLAGAAATAGWATWLGCHRRPTAPAAAALVVGGVAGLAWGFVRRPTPVSAAVRADEQLGTDDLLGTAAAVAVGRAAGAGPDDRAWADAVLAAAADRCRDVRPADVTFARYGGRAWAATGLAVASALVLAVAFDAAGDGNGASGGGSGRAAAPGTPSRDEARATRPLLAAGGDGPAVRPGGPGGGRAEDEGFGAGRPAAGPDARDPSADARPDARPPGDSVPAGDPSAAPGVGADEPGRSDGSGATGRPPSPPSPAGPTAVPRPDDPPPSVASSRPTIAAAGLVPAGTGSSATGRPGGPRPPVGIDRSAASGPAPARPADGSPPVPPWRSDEWAADIRAARQQLDAGRVPPAYRELVRRYFADE